MIFMYDPISNYKTPTNYDLLSGMTGYSKATLMTYKARMIKIKNINSYIIDENTDKKVLKELMNKEVISDEVWKTIDLFDGKYEISSYGRFRNSTTYKLITPCTNSKGAIGTNLQYEGKKYYLKFSRLVAEYFLERPENCDCVIHIGSKSNNYFGNLKWVTRKEALAYNGKFNKTNKSIYKLDPKTYEIIDEYESIRLAGKENFVDHTCICAAVKDINKTSAGYRWCEVDKYNQILRFVRLSQLLGVN